VRMVGETRPLCAACQDEFGRTWEAPNEHFNSWHRLRGAQRAMLARKDLQIGNMRTVRRYRTALLQWVCNQWTNAWGEFFGALLEGDSLAVRNLQKYCQLCRKFD
jgi:hypothetical protein